MFQIYTVLCTTNEWVLIMGSTYDPVTQRAVFTIYREASEVPGFCWTFVAMIDNRPNPPPPLPTPPPPPPPPTTPAPPPPPDNGPLIAIAVGVFLVATGVIVGLAMTMCRGGGGGRIIPAAGPAVMKGAYYQPIASSSSAVPQSIFVVPDYAPTAATMSSRPSSHHAGRPVGGSGAMNPLFMSAGLQLNPAAKNMDPKRFL